MRRGGAVGEDDDGDFPVHRFLDLGTKLVDARLEPVFSGRGVPCAIEHMRGETVLGHVGDLIELVVEEDRGLERDGFAMLGRFLKDVALRAETRAERHDRPLADRVDGRVGHLGEALFEIGVKQARVGGEDGERDVIAHREHGFLRALDHGRENHVELLGRNRVGDLAAREIGGV